MLLKQLMIKTSNVAEITYDNNAAETANYNNASPQCTEIFIRKQFGEKCADGVFIFLPLPYAAVCPDIKGASKYVIKGKIS
jgi:hypothetical protein